MKKLLLLLFLAFIFAPMAVEAQTSSNVTFKNTLGIDPRFGYYKANDADAGSFLYWSPNPCSP